MPPPSPPHDPSPSTEVEWQFDAVDLRPVDRWLRARIEVDPPPPGEPAVGAPSSVRNVDVYGDTADWRLHRGGYVLRIRRAGGRGEATLKSRSPATNGLRTRTEITEPVRTLDLDAIRHGNGPVGSRLGAMSGRRSLGPVVTIRTRRTVFPLAIDGEPAGEVALDATAIPIEGGDPVRLQRVEIEANGHPHDLEAFVARLRDACGLRPAGVSKFEAGLLAAGLDPQTHDDFGPTAIDAAATAGEAAFAVLRIHFSAFLRTEPGTRLGEDPEQLHDMRVATRRLRAALGSFAAVLPVRADRFREELGWVAGTLGEVRDLDVQLRQLDGWARTLEPPDQEGLEALAGILERRRGEARSRLIEALDSRRYDRLVSGFAAMLRHGPLRRSRASRTPVLIAGPDILLPGFDRVRRGGRRIRRTSPPESYHRLRIRTKRLRYAVEFLAPLYGRAARSAIRTLTGLQDILGEHQDANVGVAPLRALVAENASELPPAAVFAMGRIAERYGVQAATLRPKVKPALARVAADWADLERTLEHKRAAIAMSPHRAPRGLPPAPPSMPGDA